MSISSKELQTSITGWSLVPEHIKEKMIHFKDVKVFISDDGIAFSDATGRLLYKLIVK